VNDLMAFDAFGLMMFVDVHNATPREIGRLMKMPQKRVEALCNKWADRGWYEYGTTVDMGWLTDLGHARAKLEYAKRDYYATRAQ